MVCRSFRIGKGNFDICASIELKSSIIMLNGRFVNHFLAVGFITIHSYIKMSVFSLLNYTHFQANDIPYKSIASMILIGNNT